MGYDYLLMRDVKKRERAFPCGSEAIPESDLSGPLPWGDFRQWLLSIGGREHGSANSIWMEYPGGDGVIGFSGGGDNPESVYLDVHAHWKRILEAFQKMTEWEEECVIFDPQEGLFYDEKSFLDFIAREYKEG